VEIKKAKLTDFIPDSNNANKGTQRGQKMIQTSLQEDGAARSIVVDQNGNVVAGNKTLENAVDIGIDQAIVVETTGNELVVTKRMDWNLHEDESPRRYAWRDNQSALISIDFDPEVLAADLAAGVDFSGIFTDEEQAGILDGLGGEPPKEPEPPDTSKADQLQEIWEVKLGDVWQCGPHRVACGDCTDRAVFEGVMGEEKAELMVTDPPYGVGYNPAWRDDADKKGILGNKYAIKSTGKVTNDDISDWSSVYSDFDGSVIYVWSGDKYIRDVLNGLTSCGFTIRNIIIWGKPSFALSQGNYHSQHESCVYAVKKGKQANWQGDRTQSTLWDIPGMNPMGRSQDEFDERTGHGTQKPIECMARSIRNNSASGDLVYDPFLGSGTTMVAAHQLNRRCFGIEIEPSYVSVCLQRYLDLTSDQPHLLP